MAMMEFTYPSIPESEEAMLDDILGAFKAAGLEEAVSHRASLAISEAYTNAFVHGNRRDPSKQIRIRLEINDKHVIADIEDQGQGGLALIGRRKPPEPLGEGGRGIDLIRHCSNRVAFEELADGGLKVTVIVDRGRGLNEENSEMNHAISGGNDGH